MTKLDKVEGDSLDENLQQGEETELDEEAKETDRNISTRERDRLSSHSMWLLTHI